MHTWAVSTVYRIIATNAHSPLRCLLMGGSSVEITVITSARLLIEIGDVEEIAAPNLMGTETANEYVDFTIWRKRGDVISLL